MIKIRRQHSRDEENWKIKSRENRFLLINKKSMNLSLGVIHKWRTSFSFIQTIKNKKCKFVKTCVYLSSVHSWKYDHYSTLLKNVGFFCFTLFANRSHNQLFIDINLIHVLFLLRGFFIRPYPYFAHRSIRYEIRDF